MGDWPDRYFSPVRKTTECAKLENLDPSYYEMVIIDEFHHAAAPTYERLLTHLKPRYLLGLTATPERTDGRPILQHFDHRIGAELRLWHALDQQLLCPFHYFAVGEDLDFSRLDWKGGRYVSIDLENLVTGDGIRARNILRALEGVVRDVREIRALGFCVSVRHAEFMADQFRKAGLPAEAITGKTPEEIRRGALDRLARKKTNIIFTVNLFSEGVDVPEIDTVLFLRATESATVFLQQLGRGLRLAEGKECLTALDFVGHMHRKFRFDRRFRALLGGTRKQMLREAEAGFPRLPPGCAIHLDERSQKEIVENIRHSLRLGRAALAEDLRELGIPVTLKHFLEETGAELMEVFAGQGRNWTDLRRRAGHRLPEPRDQERVFNRGIGRLLHVRDPLRLKVWRHLLNTGAVPAALDVDRSEHRNLLMLSGILDSQNRPLAEHPAILREFLGYGHLVEELLLLLDVLEDTNRRVFCPCGIPYGVRIRLDFPNSLISSMLW